MRSLRVSRFTHVVPAAVAVLVVLALAPSSAGASADVTPGRGAPGPIGEGLSRALESLPPDLAPSGLLLDRSLSLVDATRFDGASAASAANRASFRQLVFQLARAAARGPAPSLASFDAIAREHRARGTWPLALLDVRAERLRRDAFDTGALAARDGRVVVTTSGVPTVESHSIVAAAVLAPAIRRGADATFVLDPRLVWSNAASPVSRIEADFADGASWRRLVPGQTVRVRWTSPGTKRVQLRLTRADGTRAHAALDVPVASLVAPLPDDTLAVVATQAHQGVYGTGRAYVRYGAGHTSLVNPIVVPEGFDLDNSMDWDPLFELLNQQGLADTLHARGFDAVVLDFTDSTRPIQENGFVLMELIRQVQAVLPAQGTLAVVGPSMGGLCSRYALAWMESHGLPHRVRTWVSFDTPHRGAVIPIGMQYWIDFFAGQSADADTFRMQLNTPAARQMLVQHYVNPAPLTPQADPARAVLLADFAAVGEWPAQPRRLSVANGSSRRTNQGFVPAAPLVRWNYSDLLVTIRGNVWALADQVADTVFDGRLRILFSDTRKSVTAVGSPPWDGAPGGWRASLAQLDTVDAPYGDIVSLHANHCFVPTISALAMTNTTDPFDDVAGDPDLLSHTPFDAVFVPDANEEHVAITPASAAWLLAELGRGVLGAPAAARPAAGFVALAPNPTRGPARIAFSLSGESAVDLRVFDVAGREVAVLAQGRLPGGTHERVWNGAGLRPGLYFARLESGGIPTTRPIVRLE